MQLGRKGVFWFTDTLDRAQLIELVERCEQLGYSALWYPEALRYESFSLGSFLLAHSKNLIIASGIANIYARDPAATKQGQHTLSTLSGGRFLLGLGVSHSPLVEDMRGHQYRRPLATMRSYLDGMEQAATKFPALGEPWPTVLAALGPQMTALGGERTSGVHPYNVTPEHTGLTRASSDPRNGFALSKRCSWSLKLRRRGKLPGKPWRSTYRYRITGITGSAWALPIKIWKTAGAISF